MVPENQLKGSYSKVLLLSTFGIARGSIALMEDQFFHFIFVLSCQFMTARNRLQIEVQGRRRGSLNKSLRGSQTVLCPCSRGSEQCESYLLDSLKTSQPALELLQHKRQRLPLCRLNSWNIFDLRELHKAPLAAKNKTQVCCSEGLLHTASPDLGSAKLA